VTALSSRNPFRHISIGAFERPRQDASQGASMTSHTVRFAIAALMAAVSLTSTYAFAPQADSRTPLVNDITNLSNKFTGLARVMAGKYDWRPGQGVRSVGDVLNLIVTENNMLAGVLSGAGGGMGGGAPITDPAALQEALRTSYDKLGQALTALPATDLNASVKLFGRDTTKQGAVLMILLDQHEHLGQSIAYARANAVVPPWSK
jgi:hypothetical protein